MLLIDTLSNDETNLDLSTSDVQFREESTHFSSFQRDSDKNDGGLIVFVNKNLFLNGFTILKMNFLKEFVNKFWQQNRGWVLFFCIDNFLIKAKALFSMKWIIY